MGSPDLFYRFGVALAIGILVGLQREHAYGDSDKQLFAGVRTFALIALLGCTAALVANELTSPWGLVGVIVAMGGLLLVAHFIGAWRHEGTGLTTEIASLLTLLAGALCYWRYLALASSIAVVTTALLSLKPEMHAFARRITREDVYATLKFAVITVIVLPLLPNQDYGWPPLDVLNPYEIWLVVVLISAISFLGYVLIKLVGARQGISLTGVLGGLISSTSVTLNFAERSREKAALARSFALAITMAWAMSYLRVIVEVATLNLALLAHLWPPLLASALVGLAYAAYLYVQQRAEDEQREIAYANPFELRTALKFGLLYAAVLVGSKAAQVYLGDAGVYFSSAIAGLPDVNAVTLSMAQLSKGGDLALSTAGRAVVIGVMSNTAAKGGIVLVGGGRELRRVILPVLALMLVTGVGVAFWFP